MQFTETMCLSYTVIPSILQSSDWTIELKNTKLNYLSQRRS